VLLRRGQWAMALLDAIQKEQIHKGDLAPEHWLQLKQHPDKAVARRAERLAEINAVVSADREEIVKMLLPLAKEKGDPARGKEVFLANCAVCHLFDGQGGRVGPDLTGIAARDRGEVLTDILDPNRSVEANYRLWNVATKGGETFSGRLETETQTTVEILDTTAQKHVVQRKDIASLDALVVVAPEASETCGDAQLPKPGLLVSSHGQGVAERGFGFCRITGRARKERLGPEAMQLRFKPPLLRSIDNSQRLGQQITRFGWVSSLSANVR